MIQAGFQMCLSLFQLDKKNFLQNPATNSETTDAEFSQVFFHEKPVLIFCAKVSDKSTFEKYIGTLLLF